MPSMDVDPVVLRMARLSAGWSQAELARRSGVSQNGISELEAGKHGARLSTVRKLAAALDVDVSELGNGAWAKLVVALGGERLTPAGLRSLRERAGLSQDELGRAAGLAQCTVSQLENGARTGSPAAWAKLAAALGMDTSTLLGLEMVSFGTDAEPKGN